MNIIEMAREAGFWQEHINTWMCTTQDIEHLATLIRAAALEEFIAATVDLGYVSQAYADDFATAIRQLKEAP